MKTPEMGTPGKRRANNVRQATKLHPLVMITDFCGHDGVDAERVEALALGPAAAPFGEIAKSPPPARIREILDRICAAFTDTISEIKAYAADRPQFRPTAERMIALWLEAMPIHNKADG